MYHNGIISPFCICSSFWLPYWIYANYVKTRARILVDFGYIIQETLLNTSLQKTLLEQFVVGSGNNSHNLTSLKVALIPVALQPELAYTYTTRLSLHAHVT